MGKAHSKDHVQLARESSIILSFLSFEDVIRYVKSVETIRTLTVYRPTGAVASNSDETAWSPTDNEYSIIELSKAFISSVDSKIPLTVECIVAMNALNTVANCDIDMVECGTEMHIGAHLARRIACARRTTQKEITYAYEKKHGLCQVVEEHMSPPFYTHNNETPV